MTYEVLRPNLDCLREEYVLIQAWKKTSSFIRSYNWFADTLALDWATVNLPDFIDEIAEGLRNLGPWKNKPLRLVPAPKSQRWQVSSLRTWEPTVECDENLPLRPLAHVDLKDQVIATAVMLCLANRVEAIQGDSRTQFNDPELRKRVFSYGHRLVCEEVDGKLYHRWGSVKLYRSYNEDYQSFVSRPITVAESIVPENGQRVLIVESDLDKFYDRVRPGMLECALRSLKCDDVEQEFFDFASRFLNWEWDPSDQEEIDDYAERWKIDDFRHVALPQGLATAGFFANVVLLAFDEQLRKNFGEEIVPHIRLVDACRYVDDLRIVVTTDLETGECETEIYHWIQRLLNKEACGLLVSRKKTKAVEFGVQERPIVKHSTTMKRIQSAISGGFDIVEGEVILETIQGLVQSQYDLSRTQEGSGWVLSPKSDVRGETVDRFAAYRFHKAYRTNRPLHEDRRVADAAEKSTSEAKHTDSLEGPTSRQELDEKAKGFAIRLIDKWVENPSNVRLLRLGLDIWPDPVVLEEVLRLLRPYTKNGQQNKERQQVAWYCLAEILRRGATETGIVEDEDCLPEIADLKRYREILCAEAKSLVSPSARTIPWYLRQQAFLFLASFAPAAAPIERIGRLLETITYRKLILFLRGENSRLNSSEFATLAVIARRAILDADKSAELVGWGLTAVRKNAIANRDPSFALELRNVDTSFDDGLSAGVKEDLCLDARAPLNALRTLTDIVLHEEPESPLRNELSILRFATAFLGELKQLENSRELRFSPGQVRLKLSIDNGIAKVENLELLESQTPHDGRLYAPPKWCKEKDRWRFQLGFLLRFILARQPDFTKFVCPEYWKERHATYRPVRSHWHQRIYGLYNGQSAFGDDWLPITDWMERFLLMLLRWPGCRTPTDFDWVKEGIHKTLQKIEERIECLEEKRGAATQTLMMPMIAEWPTEKTKIRSLRGCIVQTVVPQEKDFDNCDITFSRPEIRRKHRNHLSAALEAVKKMLYLRKTHLEDDGRLDWLILPELAVHPKDVKTHLIPFAQKFKSIILAGLTYEKLLDDKQPVNSALWILPRQPEEQGLQILTRRQGKLHIAPTEKKYDVDGFRPCQWLIGYPWSKTDKRPLWLSGAVCYDATDLNLAADLRNESDVFAIPSFNKDVGTFDQMANALNYHMFQHVIVVNNGLYGGSNAYWPVHDNFKRQIFHLHGQPQASIAFFEIEDIGKVLDRRQLGKRDGPSEKDPVWKSPPAGL